MKKNTMRLIALLLALVLALSLTACGGDSDDKQDNDSANGSLNGGSKDNDTSSDDNAADGEVEGSTDGFGDFVSVLVPEEFTFHRDSWNEENPHFVSIEKSDWTYFNLHNFTTEDEMKSDYDYVKKTYTNEQTDVSADYGGIDWSGFQ